MRAVQGEIGAHRAAECDHSVEFLLLISIGHQAGGTKAHDAKGFVFIPCCDDLIDAAACSSGDVMLGDVGRLFGIAEHADIHGQHIAAEIADTLF